MKKRRVLFTLLFALTLTFSSIACGSDGKVYSGSVVIVAGRPNDNTQNEPTTGETKPPKQQTPSTDSTTTPPKTTKPKA